MYTNSIYNQKLLTEDYQPEIKAYYFRNWNNYSMDFHTHDRVEIMYIINGACEIYLKDYESGKINFKKGDFILINAGVLHKLIVNEDSNCMMMNVEFVFITKANFLPSLREFASNVKALGNLFASQEPFFILKDYEDVYQLLKSLVIELNSSSTEQSISVQLLMYEILIKTANAALISKNESAANNYINKTKRYINLHYDMKLTVKDVSTYSNINEDYLNRIFKKNTGMSVIEYLTSVRVEKAKMLLKNTNIPIIDISDIVGISSRQYFNQVFKKVTGISPRKYRKSFEIELFGEAQKYNL
ncbi:MAG TPA: AraC family transcriptional regulator [Ruminiclostridium sp.]